MANATLREQKYAYGTLREQEGEEEDNFTSPIPNL
ncbi:hypothetical protein B6N60_02460 [Richelia sinica FACHB-800]|uniref:Uncharacterized protein n=1 Tax=Richelia sinica FACHB-800 TaxID=1357546 RepID=A0A975T829_9NOST|nr:hypothetical protein B6N60_02460 [Richelia sinica FACHB-800]